MKSLIFRLCLLVLSFSVQAQTSSSYHVRPMPAWVVAQTYDLKSAADAQTVAVLLRDTQVQLQPVVTRYHRTVSVPVSAAGIQDASALSVDYKPAFETVQLHGIHIRREGTTRDITREVRSRVMQREQELENGIHDGLVTVAFILEDVRVGDAIDFSYSITGSNPIFGQRRASYLSVDSGLPIGHRHIRILTTPDRPLQVKVFNDESPVTSRPVGALVEYRWEARQLPSVQVDQGVPGWYAPYRWMSYSEYADWAAVVAWALPLYQKAVRPDPSVLELSKKLRAGTTSDAEFVVRVLDFVQNEIRYLGLSLGANSHRPYPAADVLRRRFGDCKDKTMLLVELLAAGGVVAHPALVATDRGKGISEELPSHGAFDHVIVMLDFGGKRYWLDGTRLYQKGALNERSLSDFGVALPIMRGQDALIKMYDTVEPNYIVDMVEQIEAKDFEGPVNLIVETRYRRNAADFHRYKIASQPLSKLASAYIDYYQQRYAGIRADGEPEITDDNERNEVTIRERYVIGEYWRRDKEGLHAPVRLSAFSGMLPAPTQLTRTGPYAIPAGYRISSTFNVKFPLDVRVKINDEVLRIEHPGFLYRGQEIYRSQVYTYRSRLETHSDYISADSVQDFSKKLKKAEEDWSFHLNLLSAEEMGWPAILKVKENLKVTVSP